MNRYQKNAAWVFRVVGILALLHSIAGNFLLLVAASRDSNWMRLMLTPWIVGCVLLIVFAIPLGKLAAKGIEGD